MLNSKIKNLSELKKFVAREKRRGKTIVACSGAFDLLHLSHILFLEKAKTLGDILIVFLNSNASVRAAKGRGRPIYGEKTRAKILAALTVVDYVLIFSEKKCLHLLRQLRPHIFAQGQDWGLNCIERPVMAGHGGEIRVVKVPRQYTTTKIIKKIKNQQ